MKPTKSSFHFSSGHVVVFNELESDVAVFLGVKCLRRIKNKDRFWKPCVTHAANLVSTTVGKKPKLKLYNAAR